MMRLSSYHWSLFRSRIWSTNSPRGPLKAWGWCW